MEDEMSARVMMIALLAAVFVTAGACHRPTKIVLTKDQRMRIQENILKEDPSPQFVVNANFGDKVTLMGVDLSTDEAVPDREMTITWYWKCTAEIKGDWKVFVHLELPGGKRMILDHVPMGELYPLEGWQPGEIVRDIQKYKLDKDTKPGTGLLWAGLFNIDVYREQGGGDRMTLNNPKDVENDGHNRVKVANFKVLDSKKLEKKVPTANTPKVEGVAPAVDGKIDDEAWKATTAVHLGMADGRPASAEQDTSVWSLVDDQYLYIAFSVKDDSIEATKSARDDELWTEDVVEVYLDGGSDFKDYIELQVSPANVVFDALFESHRKPEWKTACKYDIEGLKTATVVHGTINDDGADTGYDVEIAVPLIAIKDLGKLPLDGATTLRVNLFRIDADGGKVVSAQAFSPANGDFHNLDNAGRFVIGNKPVVKAGNIELPRIQVSPTLMNHKKIEGESAKIRNSGVGQVISAKAARAIRERQAKDKTAK